MTKKKHNSTTTDQIRSRVSCQLPILTPSAPFRVIQPIRPSQLRTFPIFLRQQFLRLSDPRRLLFSKNAFFPRPVVLFFHFCDFSLVCSYSSALWFSLVCFYSIALYWLLTKIYFNLTKFDIYIFRLKNARLENFHCLNLWLDIFLRIFLFFLGLLC